MLPVTRSSRAELDIADIATYLGERNLDAAFEVLDAIEATITLLRTHPKLGVHPTYLTRSQDVDVRMKLVSHFPTYLIFYEELHGALHIHRVLHSSRNLPSVLE